MHTVEPRETISEMRNSLLFDIVSRGTTEAISAIARIGEEFPERDWTWERLRAREAAAQGTWAPRQTSEVIGLQGNVVVRQVRIASGDFDMNESVVGRADAVIICALPDPELSKVKAVAGLEWSEVEHSKLDPQTYFQTGYTTAKGTSLRVVAASPNQMGMAGSAVLTTKMIIRFRPRLVAMVGIAAGVKKGDERNFGDVLAAEHTFDYGSGKVEHRGGTLEFHPDPKPLEVDTRLLQRLRQWESNKRDVLDAICRSWIGAPPHTRLGLHVGPMGTGARVVNAEEPVTEIMEHWRKLLGLEMEAYAVHRACKETIEPAPKFLCLKSISDFAHNQGDSWREYAAFTAAWLCYRFLIEEWEALFPEGS